MGENLPGVDFLLHHKANPNLKDKYGNTPLHLITDFEDNFDDISSYQCKFIVSLMNNGANADIKNRDGKTPFYLALVLGGEKMIKTYLDHGVDLSVEDNKNNSPLCYAAKRSPNILQLILSKGCDVNEGRKPPLHCAVKWGYLKNIEILCRNGANINKCNSWNQTPLSLLLDLLSTANTRFSTNDLYHCEKLVEMLLAEGANINYAGCEVSKPIDIVADSEKFSKLFLRMVAKHEYTQGKIDTEFHDDLQYFEDERAYFKSCQDEFQVLKNFKFYDDNSILPVLLGDYIKILRYVKNIAVLDAFHKIDFSKFPIYGAFIKNQLLQVELKQKLSSLALQVLKEHLPKQLNIDIILHNIIVFLKPEDLFRLTKGSCLLRFDPGTGFIHDFEIELKRNRL